MERQAAYDLFTAFLQKRQVKGIDLHKELPGLLAYRYAKGCFSNPHTVHELGEWRKFGNLLWEAVIDDDKTAKKISKLWRVVHNELLQCQAEKRAAVQATTAHEKNRHYDADWIGGGTPLPPTVSSVLLPPLKSTALDEAGMLAADQNIVPSAPPAQVDPGPPECDPFSANEPIPGAESDLAGAMARERREAWAALAREGMENGDEQVLQVAAELACPVTFQAAAGRGLVANITALDWKLLSQLRSTVSQFGVKSEPVKQMLDYIWSTQVLLPADCRGIIKLIFSQHQQLLFNAHWQAEVNATVAMPRQPGDPLHGVTIDELMGLGPYIRMEAQALIGPDKCREAMRLVRLAIEKVKEPGGVPIYMGIKQGREEAFGTFIDKVAAAIEKAEVPEYMRGALLKQCALQNCNTGTRSVLNTLGANWTIEEALERIATMPTGPQVFLVEAIKQLGEGLQEQARAAQMQVLAALAPLQASAVTNPRPTPSGKVKCYRCGGTGHIRRECQAAGIWCPKCRSDTHNAGACRRRSGNSNNSASRSSHAPTQMAAATQSPCSQPPGGASDWTWQQQ
ncbi:GAK8 protein, partial [Lophotis ruficrista]|nr:GAK8 protein [Lophotis ruficrista]